MRYYLGIDIGKHNHQAILCDSQGEAIASPLRFPANYKGYQQLVSYLEKRIDKRKMANIHAGLEATGAYWPTLYQQLVEMGIRVTVLNPLQVKAYRNEGIRGSKTDRIDAHLIVKILRFGDYKESDIPNEDILALRQLTRLRSDLVTMTTSLKQRVIAIFDQVFPEYQAVFSDTFSVSSKALLKEGTLPEEIAAIDTRKLTRLLKKASRGRLGEQRAKDIKQAANQTVGVKIALDAFSISLEILLTQISHLEEQIDRLDGEINTRLATQKATLTTIPGVGNIIAATIIAEIGNFSRFADDKDGAEKLVALAGLDPKLRESGVYKGRAKMSKRGSPYLRKAIRQAAFIATCVAHDPMFAAICQKKLAQGKHFEVALSHVENKMLHVVYSLLKSKKVYEPHVSK